MQYLSKSLYLKSRQCAKRAWFIAQDIVEPLVEDSDVWDERAREGAEVERLAAQLFPGALEIVTSSASDSFRFDYPNRIAETREALGSEMPILQAYFGADRLIVVADIIEPLVDGWGLWEVKASTFKQGHIPALFDWDLAFQRHVARKAGLDVQRVGALMINPQFVRGEGAVDPAEFFIRVDRTSEVESLEPHVAAEIRDALTMMDSRDEPRRWPGPRCKASRDAKDGDRPSTCGHLDRSGRCGSALPEHWAGDLPRLQGSKSQFATSTPGMAVEDLDEDDPVHCWTSDQKRVIRTVQRGTPEVDGPALRRELDQIQWPVAYVDFEFDPGMAIPSFPGSRPYDRVPFQWALVVQREKDAQLEAPESFLHFDATDPRSEFAESLLDALPDSGSIVAHHASAETTVLRQLADRLGGRLGKSLLALIPRFLDTKRIAEAGYYNAAQQGSYSIKKLAPALIGRGYDDLRIGNGMAAVVAWRNAVRRDASERLRERTKSDLLDYCGRDAELMHAILEELRRLSGWC